MDRDARILHAVNDFARNTPWLCTIVSLAGYAAVRPLLRWLLTVVARTPLRIMTATSGAVSIDGTFSPSVRRRAGAMLEGIGVNF